LSLASGWLNRFHFPERSLFWTVLMSNHYYPNSFDSLLFADSKLISRSSTSINSSVISRSLPDSSHETELELLSVSEAEAISGGSASPLEKPSDPSSPPSATPPRRNLETVQPATQNTEWSPTLQDVLDQPPSNLPSRLILAGLLFSGIFAAWAWFGRIQEVSRAEGRLVPQGEVYKVQPVVQGEIAQIAVEEGESIQAGQVIAVLDDRLAEAEIDRLKQSLVTYQLQLNETQGLIERTRSELDTRRAIAQAELRAQEVAINQTAIKAAMNREILQQFEARTIAYESRLSRLQPLAEAGAVAQEFIFEAEQALQEQHITTTRNQGELQQAMAEVQRLQAEMAQRKAQGQQSELESQQQLQQLQMEMTQLRAKISETDNLLKAATTKLEQMYLYAPVAGMVTSLAIRNIGEVAQPGQTIAEIAPSHAPLVLAATLPNREAGFVHKDMPVQIKFDAFPYQEYGIVTGKVISISPDVEMDEVRGAVYRVEIALEQNKMRPANQAITFKAGQTASAEIITRQRRIADVLLDPIKKLQEGINL
jgi:hemolysin D